MNAVPDTEPKLAVPQAVAIHGIDHARLAVEAARQMRAPVPLLVSAADAGCFMGPAWWCALMAVIRSEAPGMTILDLLDCGDAAGRAMEALRLGQRQLVLSPTCPQRLAVMERAAPLGAVLWACRPPLLDLGVRGAGRGLPEWLRSASAQ